MSISCLDDSEGYATSQVGSCIIISHLLHQVLRSYCNVERTSTLLKSKSRQVADCRNRFGIDSELISRRSVTSPTVFQPSPNPGKTKIVSANPAPTKVHRLLSVERKPVYIDRPSVLPVNTPKPFKHNGKPVGASPSGASRRYAIYHVVVRCFLLTSWTRQGRS